MNSSKSFLASLFAGDGPSLATVIIILVVPLQILRSWAFSRAPLDSAQAIGCLGIAAGYLLILPAVKYGDNRVMAIMFLHLGLFGIAQAFAPSGAGWLGGFAAVIQCVLVGILLKKTRSTSV